MADGGGGDSAANPVPGSSTQAAAADAAAATAAAAAAAAAATTGAAGAPGTNSAAGPGGGAEGDTAVAPDVAGGTPDAADEGGVMRTRGRTYQRKNSGTHNQKGPATGGKKGASEREKVGQAARRTLGDAYQLMEKAGGVIGDPHTSVIDMEDLLSDLQTIYAEVEDLPLARVADRVRNELEQTANIRLTELNMTVQLAQRKKEKLEAAAGLNGGGNVESRLRRLSETTPDEKDAAPLGGGSGSRGSGGGLGSGGRFRSTSLPTWQTEGNPYVASTCNLADEYWDGFPFPWNVRPQRKADIKPGDMLKLTAASLPKFGGIREEYITWRSAFIPCVHATPLDLSLKIMVLMGTLEGRTAQMREIKASLVCTPDGYRATITLLENTFGGEDNLLVVRQQALLALPQIREGDHKTLETLHIRLGTFLIEWGSQDGGVEAESLSFYHVLMAKVEPAFGRKYLGWVRRRGVSRGLQTLHSWVGEQLEDHRNVETLTRHSWTVQTRPPRPVPRPGQWGGRGNPWPPRQPPLPRPQGETPGHLDRQQVLLGSDAPGGWEEVEEDFLGEEEATAGGHCFVGGGGRSQARCPLCAEAHGLGKCSRFLQMAPQERRDFLMSKSRCYTCFQEGHNVRSCRLRITCSKCGRPHHVLLHGARWEGPPGRRPPGGGQHTLVGQDGAPDGAEDLPPEVEDPEGAAVASEYGFKTAEKQHRVSLRTIGVWLGHPTSGKEIYVNALLDDGSTCSALVGEAAARELKLKGHHVKTVTEGVGGRTVEENSLITSIKIRRHGGGLVRVLPAQVMKNPAGSYQPVDWRQQQHLHSHLQDLELPPVAQVVGGVQLLLGNANPHLHAGLEERAGGEREPYARLTPLGWTVTGPTVPGPLPAGWRPTPLENHTWLQVQSPQGEQVWNNSSCFHNRGEPADRELNRLVRRFCEVEELPEREELAPEEKYLLRLMQERGKMEDGQFSLPCTWKPGGGRPPLNRRQALGRLESLERSKYFKNVDVKAAYAAALKEMEEQKFLLPVEMERARHFLAHFPVLKPGSLTTALRVVMDCSVMLNKYVLSGPKLMNDVVSVLLRFRSCLVGFSGDVSKMFFRIRLQEEDRPYHCLLWRDSPTEEPQAYMFQVHVFGNAGSPFVAIYALREQARRHRDSKPEAAETIAQSTLVDDILDSADSVEAAASILRQVREILGEVGMEVHKCAASDPQVLRDIPRSACIDKLIEVAQCGRGHGGERLKALGVRYNTHNDCFSFQMELEEEQKWTKRKILKLFPRLFDPLGFVLPFSLVARCIFSAVARQVEGWDEEVEPCRLERWIKWVAQLPFLAQLRIPRCVRLPGAIEQVTLHTFADASQQAYCACSYLRVRYCDGRVSVRLFMARGKVAPGALKSVPRLELLGAELAVTLAAKVRLHYKGNLARSFFWTDSLNVLFWLRNQIRRLQTFVHNRVRKILSSSDLSDWRWVPTAENPADLPTRGRTPAELGRSSLWWEGPPYLLQAQDHWPQAPRLGEPVEAIKELKTLEQVFTQQQQATLPTEILPWERWGSWQKALRVARVILRWKYRVVLQRNVPEARVVEALLGQMQVQTLQVWQHGTPEDKAKAGLRQLPLVQDEAGLLRGRSRLHQVEALPRDTREPLYLPRDHRGTKLLILHLHEERGRHAGGTAFTLALLREKFWLPQGRRTVYQTLQGCVPCKRRAPRPTRPPQGLLPSFRVPQPGDERVAFVTTAMDCAGPYRIKRGRTIELHYLLLATCCKTRAVYLEWLSEMSTDSFLAAWTRLTTRGVAPSLVVTDNGSNFLGARHLQSHLWETLRREGELLRSKHPQIDWKLNPPYASHYGGVFERLIGATKRALYHVLPDTRAVTLEQFITALSIVEGILNSRPLTYLGGELEDIPLTPSHFLYGASPTSTFRIKGDAQGRVSLARRWLQVQELGDMFWERLQKEIPPFLQASTQSIRGDFRDVRVNDVVVFLHPERRSRWPLARVLTVHPGGDGRVRTVDLRLADGRVLRRDVGALALLVPAKED